MKFKLLRKGISWNKRDGAHQIGQLEVAPLDFRLVFPIPTIKSPSEDGKVDRQWWFSGDKGEAYFGVCAYSLTSLYDRDLPSPAEFWNGQERAILSISGKDFRGLTDFLAWIALLPGAEACSGDKLTARAVERRWAEWAAEGK